MYRKETKNLCPLNQWGAEVRDSNCEAMWLQAQPAAGRVKAPRPTGRIQAAILQNQTQEIRPILAGTDFGERQTYH